jgi:hypothetical protein
VPGTDDSEVTEVERRYLRDAKPLRHGDDTGVDTAEPEIGVGVDEFGDALPVGRSDLLDRDVAVHDGAIEGGLGRRPELSVDQPAGLRHYKRRRDKRSGVALQQ